MDFLDLVHLDLLVLDLMEKETTKGRMGTYTVTIVNGEAIHT